MGYTRRDSADDHQLVSRIQQGDSDAFKQLYLQFYHQLLEFAYSLVRTRETAKDIVQDVFAQLWERRATWTVRDRLDVYLFQAVRYRSLHVVRHERIAHRVEGGLAADDEGIPQLGSRIATPDESMGLRELRDLLVRAITDLPDTQRQAILLHWRHGFSNTEVAQVMGKSTAAVAVYISRARDRLRAVLEQKRDV